MIVELNRYSKTGNTRRKQDQSANVEWDISLSKDGYLIIETEEKRVYTRKVINSIDTDKSKVS